MKIVFMGTPEFAVASLDILVKNGYDIAAVITVPDKPAGRGQKLQQSAVKKYALENGLKLLQPEKLKDESFLSELRSINADLQIVVAFRMLPEAVWNMPKAGTFNLHASLLPKYRGAAPINWAIINGEKESGVTTFKLKHDIDTGNILFQEKVLINENDNAGDLHDKLMLTGAELILKTVREIDRSLKEHSELVFTPQNDSLACHAPKIFKNDCKINWEENIDRIQNLIRGLSPYPGAFCYIKSPGKTDVLLKIFGSTISNKETNFNNGLLTAENGKLYVQCKNGKLELTDVQMEGKKRMSAAEFMRGFQIGENFFLV